jgi:hypothetical protein
LLAERYDYAGGAVFRGKRGQYTARGVEYSVAELGRRAQVPNVHRHCFRHATTRPGAWSSRSTCPRSRPGWGHERLDTVRIYSQPDQAALDRAAVALEQG